MPVTLNSLKNIAGIYGMTDRNIMKHNNNNTTDRAAGDWTRWGSPQLYVYYLYSIHIEESTGSTCGFGMCNNYILCVGGQSTIAHMDSCLYTASLHLEFFGSKWYAIENVW